MASFSIATDETYTDKQGQRQERVDWHNVVVFGKAAESCKEYLKKGHEVVCCESFIGDGGRPPGVGLQGQASNRHKLRG